MATGYLLGPPRRSLCGFEFASPWRSNGVTVEMAARVSLMAPGGYAAALAITIILPGR
jgi:hypothetical protein